MKLHASLLAVSILTTAPLAASAEAPAEPPPPPYSLPWQLRPAAIANVIRSDTSIASYEDATTKKGTFTVASLITGIYKVTPEFAPFIRVTFVGTEKSGGAANPAFGGTYLLKLGHGMRLAAFLGFAIPAGEGGGNTTSKEPGTSVRAGVLARSAMDNALFAVNDFTVFPGLDFAYVDHGFTVQVEATTLFLTRVRGDLVQKDKSKINLTAALHAGYFVVPWLSLGAELRYQRWLSTPVAVAADTTGALRDNLSFAAGPRFHAKLGDGVWLRPGLSYARGLDKPMAGADYNIVQIDVPFLF
ncbi:MAG: hypothetical protein U0359_17600 [Byssovorax sp.]